MINFGSEKKRVIKEFESAEAAGKIDNNVINVLKIINSHPEFYSTSSCSGRILLLALAGPGSKSESEMVGKWHDNTSVSEVKNKLNQWNSKKYQYLYFLAQSPIFHITTSKMEFAILLRNLGDSAGFKYSSIRSIKPYNHNEQSKKSKTIFNDENIRNSNMRITVELLSTERLNLPLAKDGKMFVDDNYLGFIVEMANEVISNSNNKIKKLENVLKNEL
jgi:tRNA wybutosine-synthesizing protein 3